VIGSPDETEDKSLTGSQTQVFLAHSRSDEEEKKKKGGRLATNYTM